MSMDRLLDAAKPENIAKRVRARLERSLKDPEHAKLLRDRLIESLEGKVVTREELYPDADE